MISCVGVSSVSSRQDDAEDESADAARSTRSPTRSLSPRSPDARWKAAVLPIYAAARDAKLAAFDRDPSNTSARRDVREARHAVAQALRATGGGAVPPACAERALLGGVLPERRWQALPHAFAQVTLGATEQAKLIEGYSRMARGRARRRPRWRCSPRSAGAIPKLERGAVIAGLLTSGPLQELALAEPIRGSRILGGRDVGDAPGFAKSLAVTSRRIRWAFVARGGTLRWKVQVADGAPREFATVLQAPRPGAVPAPEPGRRPANGTAEPNRRERVGQIRWRHRPATILRNS